jgi:hypothetical protein
VIPNERRATQPVRIGGATGREVPFSRTAALPLACVDWLHVARAALPCSKMAAVAVIWHVLTGPEQQPGCGAAARSVYAHENIRTPG